MLPPTSVTSTAQRSFAVNGPRTWNSLPAALRSLDLSLCSFKRQLKSEDLPVPSLRVSGSPTTVRRHCDCVANLAPIINRHTYLPTYPPRSLLCSYSMTSRSCSTIFCHTPLRSRSPDFSTPFSAPLTCSGFMSQNNKPLKHADMNAKVFQV